MRRLAALFIGIACAVSSTLAADTAEQSSTETLQFDGQSLVLAFQGHEPGESIEEYIPAGETLDSWTKLAAIRHFENLRDPQAYAAATLQELKRQYPQSPSSVASHPISGDVILDFVVWPKNATFVEFNVFRFQKGQRGGLVSQQYTLRAYGKEAEEFLTNLRPNRERIVQLMADRGLRTDPTDALVRPQLIAPQP